MREDREPPPGSDGDDEVVELRDLSHGVAPPPDLERRVLAEVRRRESVGYALGFAWGSLAAVLRAVLEALGGAFDPDPDREEER